MTTDRTIRVLLDGRELEVSEKTFWYYYDRKGRQIQALDICEGGVWQSDKRREAEAKATAKAHGRF
jgi:hypothetical protein